MNANLWKAALLTAVYVVLAVLTAIHGYILYATFCTVMAFLAATLGLVAWRRKVQP